MNPVKTTVWDPAKYINSKEAIIAYLEAALEENDTELLFLIISDIARSKGMSKIARELGVSREGLYRSLAPSGNPSFDTVLKLLDLLGLRIKLEQKSA
ncbi:MAG: putative addiction module antidote protein [Treponema sp.]|nr:putative addiction module antidote protein [Treponema sp.]